MVMQTFFAARVIRTLDCHCVMLITTPCPLVMDPWVVKHVGKVGSLVCLLGSFALFPLYFILLYYG